MIKAIRNPVQEYLVDAAQRWVLLLDTLRQRGNRSLEESTKVAPHVLEFEFEHILDGKTLPRPTNYQLVRIIPPPGTQIDPGRPPFVVVDPRAGHGPGIGGMKHDSEIGAAFAAGHPCYFIGFLREPVPGQTVEDVCRTEARFLEEVIARHPEAEGKPVVVANCQAGWQMMMTAALRPELTGPIMLVGSPLSYWAGVRGRNPLRYLGGLLGGTWLTALAGDMGAGRFDGANLIANFESMNPGNTYWNKLYNLYSKIDEEAPRYLEFETWWGTPILMNAEEMQWIADELFIGNKLSTGQLRASDGTRIDLRNVTSPIIVFCSWGDDITPPQQALGWITDLYDHEREIVAAGQTIVYTMHDSIGHLGIFVSGKVANKEHTEFAQCMEMIDLMPPGLYEAVITEEPSGSDPGVQNGKYLLRLEVRTLEDIRKLGVNPPEDERRFATVARVSEVNKSLYRTFASPVVRRLFPEPVAKVVQQLHPNRLKFSLLSDRNPLLWPVKALADSVRTRRQKVSADNPLLSLERTASSWLASALDGWGAMRGKASGGDLPRRLRAPRGPGAGRIQPRNERAPARRARPLPRDCPGAEPIGAPDAVRERGLPRGDGEGPGVHPPPGGKNRRARLRDVDIAPGRGSGGGPPLPERAEAAPEGAVLPGPARRGARAGEPPGAATCRPREAPPRAGHRAADAECGGCALPRGRAAAAADPGPVRAPPTPRGLQRDQPRARRRRAGRGMTVSQ